MKTIHLFFVLTYGQDGGGQKGNRDRLIADYFVIGLSTGDHGI